MRSSIPDSSNIEPSENADIFVGKYLNHITKHQFRLLPQRRQNLLKGMAKVLVQWKVKVGHHTELGQRIDDLIQEAVGKSEVPKDMKHIATKWMEYLRDNKEKIESYSKKRKKENIVDILSRNPPQDIDSFLHSFEKIDVIPDLESRVIAMIAGIPEN